MTIDPKRKRPNKWEEFFGTELKRALVLAVTFALAVGVWSYITDDDDSKRPLPGQVKNNKRSSDLVSTPAGAIRPTGKFEHRN